MRGRFSSQEELPASLKSKVEALVCAFNAAAVKPAFLSLCGFKRWVQSSFPVAFCGHAHFSVLVDLCFHRRCQSLSLLISVFLCGLFVADLCDFIILKLLCGHFKSISVGCVSP